MGGPGLAWRPFCLVGFATSRNSVSKRQRERLMRDGSREQVLCGTRFGARRCCAGEKVGRKLQGGRRWRSMRDARFQVFGGCCSGGACRFGVHEDGWMRWVAVEPCHLELRVSLGGDESPESPFLHSPSGFMATGVPVHSQLLASSHYNTKYTRTPATCCTPDAEGLVQIELCPGLPQHDIGTNPISRANCQGQGSRGHPSRAP